MDEHWKWIEGFENRYSISDTGKIRHSSPKRFENREMSVKNSKGWYLTARLYDGKRWYTKRIHRLVYETFVGEIPKGFQIHHIDGNKQNNNVSNLQALAVGEHIRKHIRYGEKKNKPVYKKMVEKNVFGQKHILQFTLDGTYVNEYISACAASRATGVCYRNISQVAKKEPYNKKGAFRKQAGGFIWKYKEKGVV